jgi:AAA domain
LADGIRLAISGTYSTGKSTTTEALSIATGIPRTHAMTSREILMDLIPGKTVMELNMMELIMLGMRRFEERVHNEGVGVDSFISDGGAFHEWVYFEARMRVGINPGAPWWFNAVKSVTGLPVKRFYQRYVDMLGVVTKRRARGLYDAYVHLPVEFDMAPDGHRPVSEKFRRLSDQLLIQALEEIGLPYHVVGGTIPERLEKIIDTFQFPVVVPIEDAIAEAQNRVTRAIEVLKNDERFHAAQRAKSLRRRLAFALRY